MSIVNSNELFRGYGVPKSNRTTDFGEPSYEKLYIIYIQTLRIT